MKKQPNNSNHLVNFIFDANLTVLGLKDKAFETYNAQLLTNEFWNDLLKKYIQVTYHKFVHHELVERFVTEANGEIILAFSLYKKFLESQPTAEQLLKELVANTDVHEFSEIGVIVNDLLPRFKYVKEGFQIARRLENELFKKAHGLTQQQLDLIDELLSEFSNYDGDAPTNREDVLEFYKKMRKLETTTSKNLTDEVVVDII